MIKAIFFDLSGVLYVGEQAIPGAVAAIARIRASQLPLRFVTNTSRRTTKQLITQLTQLGFELTENELFSAPVAAHAWLKQQNLRPYCLIHPAIVSEFSDLDQHQPNAVLIGDAAQNFCYDNLNFAFSLCLQGAPLIGIGYNKFFKLQDQLQLDAGPFIKALEFAATTKAIIIGKPATDFFAQVVASFTAFPQIQPHEILMVGDDVFGDVEGAINAGLAGCLVRTGKYQPGDEHKITAAHVVVDSVVEAVDYALANAAPPTPSTAE